VLGPIPGQVVIGLDCPGLQVGLGQDRLDERGIPADEGGVEIFPDLKRLYAANLGRQVRIRVGE
jgi:hypothetical protein